MKKILLFIILIVVCNKTINAQGLFPTMENGIMIYIDSTGAKKLITPHKRAGLFQDGMAWVIIGQKIN